MQNALQALMAVVPVDVHSLTAAVSEFESTHEPIRESFRQNGLKAEQFTNEVICFLTACDLYDDEAYAKILNLWNEHSKNVLVSDTIIRYYKFLLEDAKTLFISEHYLARLDSIIKALEV